MRIGLERMAKALRFVSAGGCGQEYWQGEQQPVVVGAPGLLGDPALGLVAADRAGLMRGGSVPDDDRQHAGICENAVWPSTSTVWKPVSRSRLRYARG